MEEDEAAEQMADNLNEENVDEYLRDAENLGEGTAATVEESVIRSSPVVNNFTTNIYPRLLQLASPTTLSFTQEYPLASGIKQGLALTHQRALECLNNFLLAMNETPSKFWFKEHVDDASKTWSWLFATAHTIGSAPDSEERNDVLEAIVGCLWALGRGLGVNIVSRLKNQASLKMIDGFT